MSDSHEPYQLTPTAEKMAAMMILRAALNKFNTVHLPQQVTMKKVINVFDDITYVFADEQPTSWHTISVIGEGKRIIVWRPGGGKKGETQYGLMDDRTVAFQSMSAGELVDMLRLLTPPMDFTVTDREVAHAASTLATDLADGTYV